MYDWLKKNQKKLLAVIGAFLMVSFLISVPLNSLSGGGHTRGAPIAHIGKTAIYTDDRRRAEVEWSMLEKVPVADPLPMRFQYMPAVNLLGESIVEQMKDHPDLFMLLIKEAESRGIDVSPDVVNSFLQNEIKSRNVLVGDQSWQNAVHDLLIVQALRNQLTSDSKFSEPKLDQMMVQASRLIRLNLVEFTTEKYSHAATQPTTQQVQTLFDQYKNVQPDIDKPADDVLGFGYEVPDRVKLQYLTISRSDVVKAAEANRRAEDKGRDSRNETDVPSLDVAANMYYVQHESEFTRSEPTTLPTTEPTTAPTTAPATASVTQPSTQASTQPTTTALAATLPTTLPTTLASTQPAVAAGPTTRPFAEVKDEIYAKILKDDATELEKKIDDAIHDKLTTDWQTWSKTHPTTLPTTRPEGYPSYGYLEGVAQEIEREFKVLPEVTQIAEWSDEKALRALPGIGSSTTDNQVFVIAALHSAPFAIDPTAKSSKFQVWQPSEIFTDTKDNNYIFRLTDASGAHAPELDSVLARVQEDARLKNAYERAQAVAAKFVDRAKRDGINAAALDDMLQVISTGEFKVAEVARDHKIPNFKASPESEAALMEKVNDLLKQASPQNPNPVAAIPMPADRMVVVVQLADVYVHIPPEEKLYDAMFFNALSMQSAEKLSGSWFKYDAVVKRMDYTVESKDKSGS